MEATEQASPAVPALLSRLGIKCSQTPLLEVALAHRSFAFERHGAPNNERLEFLGDAVLGLAVTDMIFRWFPDLPEGDMAKLRSSTVNMAVLADAARSIGLGPELFLGKGEELSGGRDKDSILADAFEAVLGALYLDCGLPETSALVERLFSDHIHEQVDRGVVRDFKTNLQELSVQQVGSMPEYRVSSSGPDHDKRFRAEVFLADVSMGSGTGRSKKQAEQAAAKEALVRLAEKHGRALGDRGGDARTT
ncbi:MAG TPA: ribonuclease III [Actinomycetota bacterium]|nr:ribonuclease III [Actinomycetota bacterium]